jgi:hypothetical protein
MSLDVAVPLNQTLAARLTSVVRRSRAWLAACHSLRVEAATVLALYGAYEATRGLVVGDRGTAVDHARAVSSAERRLHLFVEPAVQSGAHSIPHLVPLLGVAYLTLHLAVTAGLLLWVHQRQPLAFPLVRNTLLAATAISVIGFVVFPTAPPRLAGVGVSDTVSGDHIDLNSGLVSSLYNPFAAIPSMHFGYALIVGVVLARLAASPGGRIAGFAYAPFVLLVIVATGNHFLLDALIGGGVAVVGYAVARALNRGELAPRRPSPTIRRRERRRPPASSPVPERRGRPAECTT